jgi:hypothetical protein
MLRRAAEAVNSRRAIRRIRGRNRQQSLKRETARAPGAAAANKKTGMPRRAAGFLEDRS